MDASRPEPAPRDADAAPEVHPSDRMAFAWAAPVGLPAFVEGVWEQRTAATTRWCFLPTGSLELIFNLGRPFAVGDARRKGDVAPAVDGFAFLSGLHTGPLDVVLEGLHVFGVRLHPVASQALFGVPCDALLDGAVPADEVVRDLERVEDRLRSARDFASRVRCIHEHARAWAARAIDVAHAERMRRMALALARERPCSLPELHRRLGYSRSHAHRLFRTWLGQPAGDAVRLARFVRSVGAVHEGSTSLTTIAHALGYADQAHFTRTFRAYAGRTPSAYRRSRGPVPGQFAP